MSLGQNGGNTKLGQNWGTGLVRGVRPLVFVRTTGFRKVDPNATFLAGQFVKLGTDGKVTTVTANSDTPVGLSILNKSAPFYLPFQEDVEWGTATATVNLQKANIKQPIVMKADGTVLTAGTDYSFTASGGSLTNGVMAMISNANVSAGAFVTVRYQYKDASHAPFDETLASGQVTLIEDNGEAAFEVYDTSVSYAVNDAVHIDATGVISKGAGTAVGIVTRPPSADDVTLGIKITCF